MRVNVRVFGLTRSALSDEFNVFLACRLTLYRCAKCHIVRESYEWHFGRSDVSLCVCLTCKLYVVSICLCNSCTVILVLRIARWSRVVRCLLGERPCGRFTTCWVRQLGVDSRRGSVGGLFPLGLPFSSCFLVCGLCGLWRTLLISDEIGFYSNFIFRRVIAPCISNILMCDVSR